jgi:hypothetical protein
MLVGPPRQDLRIALEPPVGVRCNRVGYRLIDLGGAYGE